ncbi:hypothetical protein ACJONP_05510, partial [Mycoplasmopsis synoviae]
YAKTFKSLHKYKTHMLNPKNINVEISSVEVVRIGADITSGSLFYLIASSGIIVLMILAFNITISSDSDDAKIIKAIVQTCEPSLKIKK